MSYKVLEKWKPIPDYPCYEVSNYGKVRSTGRTVVRNNGIKAYYTPKALNPCINKHGYWRLRLVNENGSKGFDVHRLVAITFIKNPENKPQVNHIDRDRLNACVTNLEWCTAQENMKHYSECFEKDLFSNFKKRFYKVDVNGNQAYKFKILLRENWVYYGPFKGREESVDRCAKVIWYFHKHGKILKNNCRSHKDYLLSIAKEPRKIRPMKRRKKRMPRTA